MNALEVRKCFLDFFKKNGHTIVSSSPLIPAEDPTLLFTNAGMNQFKDAFLGKEKRSYNRATSIQKCVRAGGKHNDLDDVGFTPRHLTFFEMMGNFSFGDYFKKEAIQLAWDFLTKEIGLPAEKLYATVYTSDDESYDIWHTVIGLPKERIGRFGEKENFWAMGDTGPCGPCTEIHFDRGEQYGCNKPGCGPNCENCSRVMEVWNNVFMQYNRHQDGTLEQLKQTGVDTGMGFERLCTIIQKKDSVFECDVFTPLITTLEKLTGISYAASTQEKKAAFNVLCDHVRSSSLIIADGGAPSNEGRGYVLRKIIRRAALFAQKLSDNQALFPALAEAFIATMSPIYPELTANKTLIISTLSKEIERFSANLVNGQAILEKYILENTKAQATSLSGEQLFKLYDTYGFPPELTKIIVREKGFTIDMSGFEKEMLKQQEQSGQKAAQKSDDIGIPETLKTVFVGYESHESNSPLQFVKQTDDALWIVTKESPFYVESGGQVNDAGFVIINDHTYAVADLKKVGDKFDNPAIAVKLTVDNPAKAAAVKVGHKAHSIVRSEIRMNTVRNHTATHMLQAALIQTLGSQVKQAGSVVEPEYLRFDYTYAEPLTQSQITKIENLINQKIQENIKTEIFNTSFEKARQAGVIAFFGEKYNTENVRVVKIPGFSAELCGGTHAPTTGIIGAFKIISDTALATGVRRIVAVTGPKALELFQQTFNDVKTLSEMYKTKLEDAVAAVKKQQESYQAVLTELKRMKKSFLLHQIPAWEQKIDKRGKVPFLYLELEEIENEDLKLICQELEKKTPGFYFLVSKQSSQPTTCSFVGYASKSAQPLIDLKACSTLLKEQFGMKGGGNASLIQGGGPVAKELFPMLTEWLKKS